MSRRVILALVGIGLTLAACGEPTSPAGRGKPPVPSAPEPPSLWSVQAIDANGAASGGDFICADSTLRRSFARPLPSPNGDPCRLLAAPIEVAGRYAARCKAGGAHLDVQSVSTGDLNSNFEIKLFIQSDVAGHDAFSQTLRFAKLGACPAGWAAGDTAAPGSSQARNAISGATHALPAPAPGLPGAGGNAAVGG